MEQQAVDISPVSTPVLTFLQKHLGHALARLQDAEYLNSSTLYVPSSFVEFDDFKYLLQVVKEEPDIAWLSLRLPSSELFELCLENGATQQLQSTYAGVASLADTLPDYHVTLQIDLLAVCRYPETERAAWLHKLACVRAVISGAPLRHYFQQLLNNTSEDGPTVRLSLHPARSCCFVKPAPDSVSCILPMSFSNIRDNAIAIAILQEFPEARRTMRLSSAPAPLYFPARAPPADLQGFPEEQPGQASAGYVSFTFFRHHLREHQLDDAAWSMCSFPAAVRFHVRAMKTHLRSRMRARLDAMLQDLGAPPSPKKQGSQPWHLQARRSTPSPPKSPREPSPSRQ